MEINVIAARELGHYDPRTSRNGGGYWQFEGTAKIGNATITVQDTSCGDFGDRVTFAIEVGGRTANAAFCTMTSDAIAQECGDDGWCGLAELPGKLPAADWIDEKILWSVHGAVETAACKKPNMTD